MSNLPQEIDPSPRLRLPTLTSWQLVLGVVLLAGLSIVVYQPALNGQFILDDDLYVTNNQLIAAPDGLYRFWFTTEAADYYPITNSTLWLEWRLWGRNPLGYHVTNLCLHIASVLLLWATLRSLAIPGAFLAALLFAVHPVNVESVAWIAQRKNLLALLFSLLSIFCFLKSYRPAALAADSSPALPGSPPQPISKTWWLLSLLTFIAAMLSKGSVTILPVILCGLLWWQRRKLARRDLVVVAPFFLAAIALTLLNIWSQHRAFNEAIRNASFFERLAGAGEVVWFYLSKALLPLNLIFVYPQWEAVPTKVLWWLPLVAALIFTVVLLRHCKSIHAAWARPLLLGWGFFCVALLPVLGFADVGYMQHALVADHYQHFAIIGILALLGAGWSVWQAGSSSAVRPLVMLIAVFVVLAFSWLARQQCRLYQDPITLYVATLEKNPTGLLLYDEMGAALLDRGDPQHAVPFLEHVIDNKPYLPWVHLNLGNAQQQLGRLDLAIEQFKEAIRWKADYTEAYHRLGTALVAAGRPQEAIPPLKEAARQKPEVADYHADLGAALANGGRLAEAIQEYEQALRLQTRNVDSYSKLAWLYDQMQRPAEAIATAQSAIEMARSTGQTSAQQKIEDWLNDYRGSHPMQSNSAR